MDQDPILQLEARIDDLISLTDQLRQAQSKVVLERDQLKSKVARLSSKQEKARDRLAQIGERIKALESSS